MRTQDFSRLSQVALGARAVELIARDGINHQRDGHDMFEELRRNWQRWEYCGATAMLCTIRRKIFTTERVR